MSLTLYFLRHGETEYSKSGGFCGELDPELTETGKQMAQEFADAYKSQAWSGIYCSPMKRTIATAKILSESAGLTLQLRDGLKEIKYGEWEGQTAESVKQNHHDEYQRWMTEPAWNAPPGGETSIEISNRASQIIAEIVHKYADGNVLKNANGENLKEDLTITTQTIGVAMRNISRMLVAMSWAWPRSSAPMPGYAPGVSMRQITGRPYFAASFILPSALR